MISDGSPRHNGKNREYKGKKPWKAIRIVKDIMLMQINQNLELLMNLISASDREALSRW